MQIKYIFSNTETQHEAAMYVDSKQRPPITACLMDSPQLDPVLKSGYVLPNSQSSKSELPSIPNCTDLLDSNHAVTYAEVSVHK